ncbi:VPS10 domain-containing protein [Gracilimonas sp. Q87]|uniref:VPS10 domain-containing protein n=1 Tax=Gracilimonas sp. Q87 TaxID=3384766 RepID=UPI00398428CC
MVTIYMFKDSIQNREPSRYRFLSAACLAVLFFIASLQPEKVQAQKETDNYHYATKTYQAMEWRNIGPFRGGRVTAVSGVIGNSDTYYMGATGGGVWKTTDGGEIWNNISDGFFNTGSVGAIGVSTSDPNVVYVGMGESPVRGVTTSHGDGVYKSTDAGKTWTHIGLDNTRQISRVQVHPSNSDLVYVAAQGSPYGANEERGIYRSDDGGDNWELVLHIDEDTGASDMSIDMTNPRVIYAAFWDHRRFPWKIRSGGPGSSIWKTTDGGDNWEKLTEGLPDLMGKIGIDVSRANNERVYAIVEAKGKKGGLYRSDDAGKSWKLINDDRIIRARAWYYMHIKADPQDENTVYIMNAPFMKSTNGGETLTEIEVPHGDNHDLWINPENNNIMINSNDGGANVSYNGGKSWSTQRNQPTAQFYRVNTDNRFPYYVYGGQQDNSTVAIASRTSDGGIGWKDWYATAGCENAYLAFDPDDPKLVYGGCYQGIINEYNHETEKDKLVMAVPYLGLGTNPEDHKYRFNWNAPIVASPQDPSVIYHAGNHVLKTEDRGNSWEEISPDLTKNDPAKLKAGGGPITNEAAGGEIYHTIMYLMPSTHDKGTLWVGTDDGLVHITRDEGKNWQEVTPNGIEDAMINSIEVSPHDPAVAYVVATRYKFNDFTPYIYRTTDYGKSWDRIVDGIDEEAWVRVVREDKQKKDLLYAGTELGMYISFNGGGDWQPFQNNLPIVPITDLQIRNNDLVAATQGRGFWILDDLSPMQQIKAEVAKAEHYLFKPGTTYQVGGSEGGDLNQGKNPPNGSLIYYTFMEEPDTSEVEVKLDILNSENEIIRTYALGNEEKYDQQNESEASWEGLPIKQGMNRLVWDYSTAEMTTVPGYFVFGNTAGYRVKPGRYTVRLTVDGQISEQSFEVKADPRVEVTEGYDEQQRLLSEIFHATDEIHISVNEMISVRDQINRLIKATKEHPKGEDVAKNGEAVNEKVTKWIESVVQPKQETFQDVINFPNKLNAQFLYLYNSINGTVPPVTEGAKQRFGYLQLVWRERKYAMQTILSEDVAGFNAFFKENDIPAVIIGE